MSLQSWCAWLLAAAMVLGFGAPGSARAATEPEVVPGQVLVGFRAPAAFEKVSEEAAREVGQLVRRQRRLGAARVRLRAGLSLRAAMERLARRSDVAYVEPVYVRRAAAVPNDTAYAFQWALPKIQADLAWDRWEPKSQITIAILDTGVDLTHPDLAGVLVRNAQGTVVNFNALTNSTVPGAANDDNGHGTHCAGIAAARINNVLGIAGVVGWNPSIPASDSYVSILPVKVLDHNAYGNDADVAEGILWAVDQGARVINLSLGGEAASTTLANATDYARERGCVVVAAAGNDGVSKRFYPAANTGVISVGATDSSDVLAAFSNWGSWVKVAAPGSLIYSTYPGGTYATISGTSMAAPHVAGEAAAIFSQNPGLTSTQVEEIILTSVDPYVRYNGRQLGSGAGRINVYQALIAAGGGAVSVEALALAPSTVVGGTTAIATVTLTGAAPPGGTAVTVFSDAGHVTVPESVLVGAGQRVVSFPVSTEPVSVVTSATISALIGGDTQTATLHVTPPTPAALAVSPAAVEGGQESTGTVTLTGAAPASGMTVFLSSSHPAASVPPTVEVVAGATTAGFSIIAGVVTADTPVTLSATCAGVTRTVSLTVRKPSTFISGLTMSAVSVLGGEQVTGTVVLNKSAPVSGAEILLQAVGPASVPASVLVPAGQKSATFLVETVGVEARTSATVIASYLGSTRSTTIDILAPGTAVQVSLSAPTVLGGKSVKATVTLYAPAPKGGMVLGLMADNAAIRIPATVRIPAGKRKTKFTIRSTPVALEQSVRVTAASVLGKGAAELTIQPPSVRRVKLKSKRVRGGGSTVAIVFLRGKAPEGGLQLIVTSDQSVVEVPETVFVPAGRTRVKFPVRTTSVGTQTQAGISVTLGSAPGAARLTVLPTRGAQKR
jgi:thermitase